MAPDRFMQVRYEDLVHNAEAVLKDVCGFLGVSYESDMLTFFEDRPSGFYGKGNTWFDNLGRPLDPKQADKWRDMLNIDEISLIEDLCGGLLEEFGYARAGARRLSTHLRATPGVAVGALSVLAEDLVFAALPAEWRIWLINRYRKRSGRI
jgi:hypothetical protein